MRDSIGGKTNNLKYPYVVNSKNNSCLCFEEIRRLVVYVISYHTWMIWRWQHRATYTRNSRCTWNRATTIDEAWRPDGFHLQRVGSSVSRHAAAVKCAINAAWLCGWASHRLGDNEWGVCRAETVDPAIAAGTTTSSRSTTGRSYVHRRSYIKHYPIDETYGANSQWKFRQWTEEEITPARENSMADDEEETYSMDGERIQRYRDAPMEECSDPELWMRIHHGAQEAESDISSEGSALNDAVDRARTAVSEEGPTLSEAEIAERTAARMVSQIRNIRRAIRNMEQDTYMGNLPLHRILELYEMVAPEIPFPMTVDEQGFEAREDAVQGMVYDYIDSQDQRWTFKRCYGLQKWCLAHGAHREKRAEPRGKEADGTPLWCCQSARQLDACFFLCRTLC